MERINKNSLWSRQKYFTVKRSFPVRFLPFVHGSFDKIQNSKMKERQGRFKMKNSKV